jgi:long-chain fatty acid transport protein
MSRFNYSSLANHFEFRGDGIAVGATVGLLWKPHWQHSFGATYRSPFSVNFDGTAVVNNAPLPPPTLGPSPANLTMDFPQSLDVGYAFRPTKKLKLEFDVEWTNWDTLSVVTLNSSNPFVAGDPRATIPFHWTDSLFYEFGIEYTINEQWQVRAGYIFSDNTVPTTTFSPNLPDNDRDVLSAGLTFNTPRYTVNVTYQYSRTHDRAVSNALLPPGTWKSEGHAVMITSTTRF